MATWYVHQHMFNTAPVGTKRLPWRVSEYGGIVCQCATESLAQACALRLFRRNGLFYTVSKEG